SAATAAQTVNETDFSLRSSGRTYLDQKGETDRIVDRIKTSSASVIGIAGVRGAGKSSLAKKVLDKCDASGFFTLLIPSPTGYEPREFLLAIFQRIAEHASDRIQTVTQGAEDLASLGRRQLIQMRWRLLSASGVLLLVILGGLAAVYLQMKLWTMQDAAVTRGRDIDRAITAIQDVQHLAQWVTAPSSPLASAISSDPRADRIIAMLDRLNDDQLNRLETTLKTDLDALQSAQNHRRDHVALGLFKIKDVQSRRAKKGALPADRAPPANFAQYTAAEKIAATGELPLELEALSDRQLSDLLKALN